MFSQGIVQKSVLPRVSEPAKPALVLDDPSDLFEDL
jgi:hypothetical protein